MPTTEELLQNIERLLQKNLDFQKKSPWSLSAHDDWELAIYDEVNITLAPGETKVIHDERTEGWFQLYTVHCTNPLIEAHLFLEYPGGSHEYVTTIYTLNYFGYTSFPGNHWPWCPKYDTDNDIYVVLMSPPYPGLPFRGRVYATGKNTADVPLVVVKTELWFIRLTGSK